MFRLYRLFKQIRKAHPDFCQRVCIKAAFRVAATLDSKDFRRNELNLFHEAFSERYYYGCSRLSWSMPRDKCNWWLFGW